MTDLSLIRPEPLREMTLTAEAAAQKLGIGRKRFQEWLRRGVILANRASQSYQISAAYIQVLLDHNGSWVLDWSFAEHFALYWCVGNGTVEEREVAQSRVAELLEGGKLIAAWQAGEALGVRKHTLTHWRKRGHLRWLWSHPHGPTYYLTSDITKMRRSLGTLTVYEAAERLSLSVSSVKLLASAGKLPSFKVLSALRFEVSALEAFRATRDGSIPMLRAVEARKRLGIQQHVLCYWTRQGVLTAHVRAGRSVYDEAEIEALYAELTAFNPGFEWLSDIGSKRLPHTEPFWLSTAKVAIALRCSEGTVLEWRANDLLPCCRRLPSALKRAEYSYPAAYIRGLWLYASRKVGVLELNRKTVVAYKAACQEEGRII